MDRVTGAKVADAQWPCENARVGCNITIEIEGQDKPALMAVALMLVAG